MDEQKVKTAVGGTTGEMHQGASQAQLAQELNDASIDQILAMDNDLCIIAWNRACEQVTGIAKYNALGRKFFDVLPAAQNYPQVVEALNNALKGFKSYLKWEHGSYNGGYFENHFIPLKNDRGEVTGVLNIVHDVAHRIKAERELEGLNEELWKKNMELTQRNAELANFTAIASHDLKEPLRKIYTFAELIMTHEAHKLSDAGRSNFRRIQKAVQRMGLLTDDIVTFSEVNKIDEKRTVIDLNNLLLMALHPFQAIIAHTEALILSAPLPQISGYDTALLHLFRQLVSNSLKFQPEGNKPRINIDYELVQGKVVKHQEALPNAQYHCIRVSDNGIGFEREYAERIFGMFQRLHREGAFKGSGMGLAICKKAVQLHHGFITADSEPGEGSTFSSYLLHEEV